MNKKGFTLCDGKEIDFFPKENIVTDKPVCDCGTWKTYGKKVPLSTHSNWCKLRTVKNG